MGLEDVRKRYSEQLLDYVRETRYPSVGILQRVETGIRDMDTAVEYVELLMEKVQDQFPSVELLDRISTLLRRLEQFDRARGNGQRQEAE